MKKYTILVVHSRRGNKEVEGTIEELKDYFGYTLEVGNSYKKSINLNPKTIKSFISNLQKSYEIKEGACYERTYVSLKGE